MDQEWQVVDTKEQKRQQREKSKEKKARLEREANLESSHWQAMSSARDEEHRRIYGSFKGGLRAKTVFAESADMEKERARLAKEKLRAAAVEEQQRERELERARMRRLRQKEHRATTKAKGRQVEQAAALVESHDLAAALSSIEQRYGRNEELQLMLAAEHVESLFADCELPAQLTLNSDDQTDALHADIRAYLEQPASEVGAMLESLIGQWLLKFSTPVLSSFLWLLTGTLLAIKPANPEEANRWSGVALRTSTVGVRLMMQIVCRQRPKALLGVTAQLRERCFNAERQQALRMRPFLFWLLAQPLDSDPSTSLALWFEFQLPLLFDETMALQQALRRAADSAVPSAESHIALYVVDELMTRHNPQQQLLRRLVGVKHETAVYAEGLERMLHLLQVAAGNPPETPASTIAFLRPLAAHLPALMDLSVTLPPSSVPGVIFAALLNHAAHESAALRGMVLEKIGFCLLRDSASCLTAWRSAYKNSVRESNNVLVYLLLHWHICKSIDAETLRSLLHHFQVINAQLSASARRRKAVKPARGVTAAAGPAGDAHYTDLDTAVETCSATCVEFEARLGTRAAPRSHFGNAVLTLLSLGVCCALAVYSAPQCCASERCLSTLRDLRLGDVCALLR